MQVNGIDWGALVGSLGAKYLDVKKAKQDVNAINAQAAVIRAQNEASFLPQISAAFPSTSGGISQNTLMYAGIAALVLVLLLGGRK